MLKEGSAVDATLIAAPSSTRNKDGKHDSEMHSSKKGNQWYFGMRAHIGVDADSGRMHTVRGTAGHAGDAPKAARCCMGKKALFMPMRVIKVPTNGLMSTPVFAGRWPCVQTSAKTGQDRQPCRCAHRQNRKAQGQYPGQGRAPVSCHQAPVWLREGTLPGPEEKQAAAQNAVWAVEPVDGSPPTDDGAGMSASESRGNCLEYGKNDQYHLKDGSEKPTLKGSCFI